MLRRTPRRGFLRTIVAAAVLAGPVGTRADQVLDLQLRDGRLSAHVVEAPLAAVLAQVATLSGANVIGVGADEATPTSATFTALPLEAALDRLLQGRNHYVVRSRDDRPRRIVLLGAGATVLTPTVPADRSSAAPEPIAPGRTADEADPVLAETVRLLTASLAAGDAGLRRQILDDIATWRTDDPSRTHLLARLADDTDPAVREAALGLLRLPRPNGHPATI
jgi:hypothetical protein